MELSIVIQIFCCDVTWFLSNTVCVPVGHKIVLDHMCICFVSTDPSTLSLQLCFISSLFMTSKAMNDPLKHIASSNEFNYCSTNWAWLTQACELLLLKKISLTNFTASANSFNLQNMENIFFYNANSTIKKVLRQFFKIIILFFYW